MPTALGGSRQARPLVMGRPGAGRRRALLGIFATAVSLAFAGCGLTSPLYVESNFGPGLSLPGAPALAVAVPVDARRFTNASNRAPVPSVQGDPRDTALTARTLGRRPNGTTMLGPNVTLPPGETVALWVQQAIVAGLQRANVSAVAAGNAAATSAVPAPAETPQLDVTILAFWLDVKSHASVAIVEYRAEIEISGRWPRFGEGRTVSTQGTVSSAGLDNNLWRRTFDRLLDEIAAETARAANPAGTAG